MVQVCNPCCSEAEAGSWEFKDSLETEIGEKKTGDIVQQQVLAQHVWGFGFNPCPPAERTIRKEGGEENKGLKGYNNIIIQAST